MDEITTGAAAGGSGIVGVILTWLGFKARIRTVEKDLKELRGAVRYEVTCKEINHAIHQRLENIEEMQKETREDVKILIGRK